MMKLRGSSLIQTPRTNTHGISSCVKDRLADLVTVAFAPKFCIHIHRRKGHAMASVVGHIVLFGLTIIIYMFAIGAGVGSLFGEVSEAVHGCSAAYSECRVRARVRIRARVRLTVVSAV